MYGGEKLIRIGICDDVKEEREKIHQLCEEFFEGKGIEYNYVFFESGEEVLEYCEDDEKEQITLLFLDVEMGKISGIQLKEEVIKQDKIWRLLFVTSHSESVYAAFSLKTMGFIKKPAQKEEVFKNLSTVLEEWNENVVLEFKGYNDQIIYVRLEDIIYFNAEGSCVKIHTYKKDSDGMILSKKLGDVEKEMAEYFFVRVHKSYLVNLANVTDVKDDVKLDQIEDKIPIGRSYKEAVRKAHLSFGKRKVIKRL